MPGRKVKIDVMADGGMSKMTQIAAVDLTYQRLFESAKAEIQSGNFQNDAGIRMVLFGCFWLEAVCNETLRDVLQSLRRFRVSDRISDVVWKELKRSRFLSKLRIIAAFESDSAPAQTDRLTKNLVRLFDLRNRLVHFKDEDETISDLEGLTGALTEAQFVEFLASTPEPSLTALLNSQDILEHSKTVLEAIAWLAKARQQNPVPIV